MVTGSVAGMACLIIQFDWWAGEQRSVSLSFAQGQQGLPPAQHLARTVLLLRAGGSDKVPSLSPLEAVVAL
jgi:hypothetical protein